MNEGGLKRRLSRTFGLQAGAIAIATVLGIYLAGAILEEILITQALREEAEHYWQRHVTDPDFPLPDTHNLTGYIAPVDDLAAAPDNLRGLAPGFHDRKDTPDFSTVYVSDNGDERLYLVFDGEQVNQLAAWFGIVPLTLVLLVLYLSVWIAYRLAQRAVSPITVLANEVNRLDPDSPDPRAFRNADISAAADDEVHILSTALAGFAERLGAFVERERNFTRDASHELRTPLTVIGIATEVLLARDDLPAAARRDIERIRRSARDMEELVEAFLLLARESEGGLANGEVSINDVVAEEVDRLRPLIGDKPVEVAINADCRLAISAPPRVAAVLLSNLIRNAFAYTESGSVDISIDAGGVTVADTGVGMTAEQVERAGDPFHRGGGASARGHGIGLSIVRRLSDRFDWPVNFDSMPGAGARVLVSLPRGRATTLHSA